MVECDPLASISWMILGAARWFVGRTDEAVPDLEHSLELDPQNFLNHWAIGYTYASLGRLAEAGRHAASCHEAAPENAYAVQEHKSNNSSNSSNKIGAAASGNIADFLPVFGGSSNMDSDYKGTNGSQQKDRLTGRLTVRIVEKTESGMFKIKGEREVGVNGEDNIMKLEGYVRPKDISTDNIIYSYQIADAKIDYRQGGLTDSFIKPGTFPKIFTFLAGGLMVAAGAGYFVFSK